MRGSTRRIYLEENKIIKLKHFEGGLGGVSSYSRNRRLSKQYADSIQYSKRRGRYRGYHIV
jgi:hypothetical protein